MITHLKLDDRLSILRAEDRFRNWESLDDKRVCMFAIAIQSGDTPAARAIVADIEVHWREYGFREDNVGEMLARLGQFDEAMNWFDRAIARKLGGFEPDSPGIPRAFYRTPRWRAFMNSPDYKTWQTAKTEFVAKLANAGR